MKNYRETYVRKAEIAQLIILHKLYSLPGSRALIFQGGTALRWCYGGSRFSEDLDFVTHLDMDIVRKKLNRMLKAAEMAMIPHFGPGALTASEKTTRKGTLKLYMDYRPVSSREKISVKLEFEGLRKETIPETRNYILSSLPSVSYLIAAGDFRIPRPNTVLVAETLSEILSDKIRALFERRYLKGRDIFDIWYLRTALNTAADKDMIERKLRMYIWSFHAARDFDFFANPLPGMRDEMIRAIREDLSRFLPPHVFAVHQSENFDSFLSVLKELFGELLEVEVKLP
jgi:predicted nucleotidyltransferase component of viral defense system